MAPFICPSLTSDITGISAYFPIHESIPSKNDHSLRIVLFSDEVVAQKGMERQGAHQKSILIDKNYFHDAFDALRQRSLDTQ